MSTIANPTDIIPAPSPNELGRPISAAGAPEAAAFGGAEAWRIIKEKKILIGVTFTLLFLMAVGATFAVRRWAPIFSAEAFAELAPPPREIADIEAPDIIPDVLRVQVESEARKIRGLDVIQQVLRLPEVKATKYFRSFNDDFNEAMYTMEEDISCTPLPDTNIIRVRFGCADPTEARDITNALINAYWSKYKENATAVYSDRKNTLSATLDSVEKDRKQLSQQITAFRARSGDLPQLENQRSALTDQLTNLNAELTLYKAHAAQLEGQLQAVQAMGANLPVTPEMKIIVEADPILRLWRQQAEAIEVEMNVGKETRIGPKHLMYKQMETRRAEYMSLEAARRNELISDLRDREVENLRQSLASARSVLATLGEDLAGLEARQRDMDASYQEFSGLVQKQKALDEQFLTVSEALRSAEHALADRSRIRFRIVQSAMTPMTPSRPNWFVYLGGGALLSLMISFGLAFLREFTDNAVRTPIDVTRHGRVSVLGCIPELDDEEADVDQIEQATRIAPQSLVAESFRQVRTNLLFSGPAESQRTILVTSASPGDGKTAIAINLAVSLARGNQRVLLIDCNFRRPGVRAAFPNTRAEGLSNILVGQVTLPEVVTKTDIPNLDVLTTGPMPPTPAELLGTRYMRELLTEALTRYDKVVLDGPPVLLISDALVLATEVDGVVLVTRAVNNSKGALKRARDQLAKVNARVLGAILNCVKPRPGGYFKRQYREFYEYTSDETIPRELPMTEEKGAEQTA